MAQKNQIKIVSPKGTAVYPWLNRPDTKFSADGDYKVTLKVSADEAVPLIQKLDDIVSDYHKEQSKADPKLARYNVSPPYEEEMDDQGNLTGFYLFKFKQKAKIHTKDGRVIDMKVALVDASRTPTTVNIGGGSEIKIAATVFPYAMSTTKTIGLSLRPSAVQIITLVQGQSNVVSLFDQEDGFKTEDAPTAAANGTFSTQELDTAADF
jgi:hypothetical protein